MARTQGHGNPRWNREETILALELYHEMGGEIPSEMDERVRALSALLQRLTYHPASSRKGSFRNPAGVVFKLQNLHQVATGNGLEHVSAMDQRVWTELGEDLARTKELATNIKEVVKE